MNISKICVICLILGLIFLLCFLGTPIKEGMCTTNSISNESYDDILSNSDSDADNAYAQQSQPATPIQPTTPIQPATPVQPSQPATPSDPDPYDPNNTQGIPASQIANGDEDLYILKSEIVPPVCPACPMTCPPATKQKCQPCPPCARCPEPAFECKKVPNYNTNDDRYLPMPVLNDFSQFGM